MFSLFLKVEDKRALFEIREIFMICKKLAYILTPYIRSINSVIIYFLIKNLKNKLKTKLKMKVNKNVNFLNYIVEDICFILIDVLN